MDPSGYFLYCVLGVSRDIFITFNKRHHLKVDVFLFWNYMKGNVGSGIFSEWVGKLKQVRKIFI
ncbi:hypothetical protein JOD29_000715 [Lysinibacillus composti]|nr:hypothetical protein [Lysinibacillus composti]